MYRIQQCKVIVLAVTLFLLLSPLRAQFSQGRLQATGLTCALCSKSIHEALDLLPFIESVMPDLKTSSFDIRFKAGQPVLPRSIRTAVEDAGFFVGKLLLEPSGSAADSVRMNDRFQAGEWTCQLLEKPKDGQWLQVIEKGFLTEKEYKRFLARYPESATAVGSVIYLLPVKK